MSSDDGHDHDHDYDHGHGGGGWHGHRHSFGSEGSDPPAYGSEGNYSYNANSSYRERYIRTHTLYGGLILAINSGVSRGLPKDLVEGKIRGEIKALADKGDNLLAPLFMLLKTKVLEQESILELVKHLVKSYRVKFDYVIDESNRRPLYYATLAGNIGLVGYIVRQFRNIGLPGDEGTALHLAAIHGHLHIVRYLVEECGISPNIQNQAGNTVMHLMAERGLAEQKHLDVIRYLIEREVDPNLQNSKGRTVLHSAFVVPSQERLVCEGRIKLAVYLIDAFGSRVDLTEGYQR